MLVFTFRLTVLLAYILPVIAVYLSPLVGVSRHGNQSIPMSLTASVHEIRCLGSPSHPREIHPAACDSIMDMICDSISAPDPHRARWVWASVPGCALGYYIPDWSPIRRLPTFSQCKSLVFRQMILSCAARPPREMAVINVRILPDNTHTGAPMREGWPRYIMAEEIIGRNLVRVAEE